MARNRIPDEIKTMRNTKERKPSVISGKAKGANIDRTTPLKRNLASAKKAVVNKVQATAATKASVTKGLKKKAKAIPKSLAKCADELYVTKEERLRLGRDIIDPLTNYEKALKEHLINKLPASQAAGITGNVANATIKKETVWRIEDHDAFMKFARRKGNERFLRVVANDEAIAEAWEAGKKIPGIADFTFKKISLTKAK